MFLSESTLTAHHDDGDDESEQQVVVHVGWSVKRAGASSAAECLREELGDLIRGSMPHLYSSLTAF